MKDAVNVRYEFGPYVLAPGHGLLLDEIYVHTPPKELALLELLVEAEGNLVTVNQIENSIWPNQLVSSASIARCLYALRKLLSKDGHNFVSTVPRRGYRLEVPVRRVEQVESRHVKQISSSVSAEAFSHYVEGLREANRPDPAAQARAKVLFEEAHRCDSTYVVPLAAIADTCMSQAIRGYREPREASRIARGACERALAVNPEMASVLAALGWFRGMVDQDLTEGFRLLDQALALDPEYARGHSYRAWLLRSTGLCDPGINAARRAVELDPHSMLTTHCLAWTLFCCGEVEEGLELERRLLRDKPYIDIAHGYVAIMAAWLGQMDEALAAGQQAALLSDRDPGMLTTLSYALARAGRSVEARAVAEESERAIIPRATRSHIAPIYVEIGETDRALELLKEARRDGCPFFLASRFDPRLSALAQLNEAASG